MDDAPETFPPEGEELPPPMAIGSPPGIGQEARALAAALAAADMIVLAQAMEKVQAEVEALKVTDLEHREAGYQLAAAALGMPCPQGKYVGLPEEGWTGNPADAPGATPASVQQCMASGGCACQTGAALSSSAWVPAAASS